MKQVFVSLMLAVALFVSGVSVYADDGGGEFVKVCLGMHCTVVPADDGGGE